MNIGFDAKRAFHNFSGLGNYSRLVIGALAKSFHENQYHLFTPSKTDAFDYSNLRNISVHTPASVINKTFPSAWRRRGIIRDLKKARIDLYHGLSNELPWGISNSGARSVVSVHDLIFKRYPQYYPAWDRRIYDAKSRAACEAADHIIAVSHQTRNDLLEFYDIPPEKVSVIYSIVDPSFFTSSSTDSLLKTKNSFRLPDKFILYVGTIEKRKNLLTLVKAFSEIKGETDARLIVVGKPKSYKASVTDYLSQHQLQNDVLFLENVATDQLRNIYQLASIFVYPSFYEGFGLPISEALALGVPVIASDIPVLKEAGGDAARYTDPDDAFAMADTILNLLNNEPARVEMIQRGKIYSNNFRGERIAGELMTLYHKIISG
jgi:glycosyltransferase involved in cell wall biosynthesis